MVQELLKAFILIFIAEMGDKTQILAMAFATKFPVKKVITGIFLGSFLNHGLGILLGHYISNFIPINTIQIVAGFAFVGFSLWTLKSDDEDEEKEAEKSKFGAVITVALAFFIGELGDKTQLTAITLSIDAAYPLVILAGSVSGMIATGALGIIVGKKLGDKIPEFTMKIIAASIFMFFGLTKLYETLPDSYLTPLNIILFLAVLVVAVVFLLRPEIIRRRQGRQTLFKKTSKDLYDYYNKIQSDIGEICLGTESCGSCKGNSCVVAHTKILIKKGLNEEELLLDESVDINEKTLEKKYDKNKVIESLITTLEVIKDDPSNPKYENLHKIRKNLEKILFGKSIENIEVWSDYSSKFTKMDSEIADRVFSVLNN